MVDALGAVGSENSLFLLTTEVIANLDSSPDDIMHALIHLFHLRVCPPQVQNHHYLISGPFISVRFYFAGFYL